MIVEVIFRKRGENEYGGRPYSYETELDVKVDDIVVCPTASGLNYGKVVRTNVDREEIPPNWRDSLREIVDVVEDGNG